MSDEKLPTLTDWAPRSEELPFEIRGKKLRVIEMTLYQRDRVVNKFFKNLSEVASNVFGSIKSVVNGDNVDDAVSGNTIEDMIKAIMNVFSGDTTELIAYVLSNSSNLRTLGIISEDEEITDEAVAKMKDVLSNELTFRQEIYILRTFLRVEKIGEILGNLTELLTEATASSL